MKLSRILFISFTLCIVFASFSIKKERDENRSLYKEIDVYNKEVAELTRRVAEYKTRKTVALETKYTDSLKGENEELLLIEASLEALIDSLGKQEERIEKERLRLVKTNWFFAKPQ